MSPREFAPEESRTSQPRSTHALHPALSSHLLMLPEGSSSSRLICYPVRAVLASGQGRDAIDLHLNDARQLERIGGDAQSEQLVHLGPVDAATGPQQSSGVCGRS